MNYEDGSRKILILIIQLSHRESYVFVEKKDFNVKFNFLLAFECVCLCVWTLATKLFCADMFIFL